MPTIKTKKQPTVAEVTKAVTELAEVKRRIADLQVREEQLKTDIVASGAMEVNAGPWRCTVSRSMVERVDYKGVVADLPPSPELAQLMLDHTESTERVQVRVTARKEG